MRHVPERLLIRLHNHSTRSFNNDGCIFLVLRILTTDANVPIFYGNTTDYFKLLDQDEHSLLIGARYVEWNVYCVIMNLASG